MDCVQHPTFDDFGNVNGGAVTFTTEGNPNGQVRT